MMMTDILNVPTFPPWEVEEKKATDDSEGI